MFRHRKRAYSKPGLWLGGSLVALMAVAVALLVPTLGVGPVTSSTREQGGTADLRVGSPGRDADRHDRHLVEQPDQLRLPVAPLPVKRRQRRRSNCTMIPGATASSYTLAAAEVGFTIRVRVTATNTDGSATRRLERDRCRPAAPSAPKNTTPPTITGTPQEGQTWRQARAPGAATATELQRLLGALRQDRRQLREHQRRHQQERLC